MNQVSFILISISFFINIFLDWQAKRKLFANLLLRSYCTGVFDPSAIFKKSQSEEDFVDSVYPLVRSFVSKNISENKEWFGREVSLSNQ